MPLNLKLLRSHKSIFNLWRPQLVQSNFIGRSAMASKHNILFQNQTPALTATAIQARANATTSHASSMHWNLERALAIGLFAIIPASLILETAPTDYLLAASLTLHAHWGLQAIVTDYVHGRTLPKFAHAALYAVTALVFAGLCYFNYNDIGLTKAVKKIWAL